jgi:ketosteroid isomerase-like protein
MDSPLERLHVLYEEWARGDFSRAVFDDQTRSRTLGWIDLDTELEGTDEILGQMRRWLSAWEHPIVIEVDEFIESGDRILVLIRWRGRGKGSGVEMESEGAHLWTFRDGRTVRWDVYRDRDEARAALGGADPGGDA